VYFRFFLPDEEAASVVPERSVEGWLDDPFIDPLNALTNAFLDTRPSVAFSVIPGVPGGEEEEEEEEEEGAEEEGEEDAATSALNPSSNDCGRTRDRIDSDAHPSSLSFSFPLSSRSARYTSRRDRERESETPAVRREPPPCPPAMRLNACVPMSPRTDAFRF
jgi:hypothetical protein